jgi:hypothetical protein
MQTLTFNTTTKNVKLNDNSTILYVFDNVPTVKILEGYYEVIQENPDATTETKRYPVARFPIANTNMIIEK